MPHPTKRLAVNAFQPSKNAGNAINYVTKLSLVTLVSYLVCKLSKLLSYSYGEIGYTLSSVQISFDWL